MKTPLTKRAPAGPGLTKSAAPFELKELDEAKRTFRGLASTWQEDLGGDVIHRGAFKKTLQEWKASRKVIPLIDQHNYGSIRAVIGKMLSATETDAGLETEWEVIEGPDGDEAIRRVKGGFIDSMSIGYEAVKWEMERPEGADPWDQVRHLKEVKLYEVSLVIWPMNPGAVIDPGSLKGLMQAFKDGTLTDEQLAEIRALPADAKDRFRALLDSEEPPAPPKAADTPEGGEAAQFGQTDALRLRIRTLKLREAARGALR
jgi:HK97 family phage prohead protease